MYLQTCYLRALLIFWECGRSWVRNDKAGLIIRSKRTCAWRFLMTFRSTLRRSLITASVLACAFVGYDSLRPVKNPSATTPLVFAQNGPVPTCSPDDPNCTTGTPPKGGHGRGKNVQKN